jgi:predicted HicB family RNase H-like nuclease
MSRSFPHTSFRLKPEVRQAAKRAAEDDNRSLNGWVATVIAAKLAEDGYLNRKNEASSEAA